MFHQEGGSMRILMALIFGFFSGILIYMEVSMILMGLLSIETFSSLFFIAIIYLFGGIVLSVWVILKYSDTAIKACKMGALIGALEWVIMIPVGFIYSGIMNTGQPDIATGAAQGIFSILTGGFSVFMVFACLVVFAVFYFIDKEVQAKAVLQETQA